MRGGGDGLCLWHELEWQLRVLLLLEGHAEALTDERVQLLGLRAVREGKGREGNGLEEKGRERCRRSRVAGWGSSMTTTFVHSNLLHSYESTTVD